ncbi:hypothetical protein FOA52_012984 [Chlamydomonas sp. UWO 241]|nr:hypothetical protein FOA52_012984 [Chlamydomonas sp. UWO 241]
MMMQRVTAFPRAGFSRTPRASVAVRAARVPGSDVYTALVGKKVFRSTDGSEVQLTAQWGPHEKAVIAFTRSLGCPFCQELAIQLRRDLKPQLDTLGVRMLMVSIGTPERSKDFVARTGFPAESLFVDPINETYDALGLTCDLPNMLFNPATPLSLLKRGMEQRRITAVPALGQSTAQLAGIQAGTGTQWAGSGSRGEGKTQDLATVLNGWQPWMTPNGVQQSMQQGGMFVFEGADLRYAYYDKATGDHADLAEVAALVASLGVAGAGTGGDEAMPASSESSPARRF